MITANFKGVKRQSKKVGRATRRKILLYLRTKEGGIRAIKFNRGKQISKGSVVQKKEIEIVGDMFVKSLSFREHDQNTKLISVNKSDQKAYYTRIVSPEKSKILENL